MAYDVDLADRVRELLGDEPGVTERPMFGGLAFFVGDHMAMTVSGRGGVLVRVDQSQAPKLVASGRADVAIMRGRRMRGWLRVSTEHLRTKRQLEIWVHRAIDQARSLPAKGEGHSRS
jgi:TfoX/Sxy family transcriptional regulator of competence genes